MPRSTIKTFAAATTAALCLTAAGTAGAIAPPPFMPPSSNDQAPATPAAPAQPAPATQQQQQTQQNTTSSDASTTAPPKVDPPTGNDTVLVQPPVAPAKPNAKQRHTRKHRRHARKHRQARRRVHAAMTDGAHPGVSCGYQQGTRNAVVWNDAPAQRPDAGLDGQYVAYQPSYYWYDFSTGQWQFGGDGTWVWTYSQPAVYGSEGYHTFTGAETSFDGSEAIYVTPGYYWRVAIHTYWYPTDTTEGHFGSYEWAGDHTAFFPPAYSDAFGQMLDQTQQVVDQWCWVPAS